MERGPTGGRLEAAENKNREPFVIKAHHLDTPLSNLLRVVSQRFGK